MAEEPAEAGVPRTRDVTRVYEGDGIRVIWRATRCTHAAACLRGSPTVFRSGERPWVDVSGAPPEEIAATVRSCPTGALLYEGSAVAPEEPHVPTEVRVVPDGPLVVRGLVRIEDADGGSAEEVRAALCRCGASQNKPFCDNSHLLVGFDDDRA